MRVEELEITRDKYNSDLINLEKENFGLQKKADKLTAEIAELVEDKQNLLDYIKKYHAVNKP